LNSALIIGLSSWIIADGNYEDFKRGDKAQFALEFHAINSLDVVPSDGRAVSLQRLHDCTYRILGKIVHIRDRGEWWAIDVGVLMYQMGRLPAGVEEGSWITGEAYVGIDHYSYMQRFSRHHTAPGLIYDWNIKKIEIQTAPFIRTSEGVMARDPEGLGWKEIEATHAYRDGVADYILHCERLNNPPRR
jgi:hypothetical protein